MVPLETMEAFEEWLGADWTAVLKADLKGESNSSMIFGGLWLGFALMDSMSAAANVPDARLYMLFNAVFGGMLFTLAARRYSWYQRLAQRFP